jgi:hypothetical protein
MSNQKKFNSHSKLSFTGAKIKPAYAKFINDAMFEMTQIEGTYVYDTTGVLSKFTIHPKIETCGDDSNEHDSHLNTYIEIYKHVIKHHPECLIQ